MVLSVLVGLGGAYLLFADRDTTGELPFLTDREGPELSFEAPVGAGSAVEIGDGADSPVPTGNAQTPLEAATAFLAAEVEGDTAASHAHLAGADRERYNSVARWRAAHAQFLPVLGFRIDEVEGPTAGAATVQASVRLASSLDLVLGLVPARADLALAVVEEDGRWAVDWSGSTFTARYPDESAAVDAARSWAQTVADCGSPEQYEAALFGTRSLVDDLCAAGGPVELGDVTTLPSDGGDRGLVSSFGASVVGWARVVPVTSPVAIDVVLAPVDDEWLVIGVLQPRT